VPPTSWDRRRLPSIPDATTLGDWQLTGLAALTAARQELAELLVQNSPRARADRDDIDQLLLTFEELASNGLRHGEGPVRARVTRTSSGWLIDVADRAVDRPPVPALDRDPALGGLGLHLVARLCPAHGWSVLAGHKHVWACVPSRCA
jgi:two-component sensor histidine kinase